MIKYLFFLLVIFALAVLQISAVNYLPSPPQIILVLGLIFLIGRRRRASILTAFFGGFFLDLIASNDLGLTSFYFLVLYLAAAFLRKTLPNHFLSSLFIVFLVGLLYRLIPAPALTFGLPAVTAAAAADLLVFSLVFLPLQPLLVSAFGSAYLQLDFKDRL